MSIRAKKSLGQNFLTNNKILGDIANAGKVNSEDTVLEIGPGPGDLTNKLLELAGKVIAIEKDDRLIPILKERFSKEIAVGKFQLIHSDILDFNPDKHPALNLPKELIQPNADQGASEKRTEPYVQYGEGASERSNAEMRRMEKFSYKLVANIPYYLTGAILRKFLETENKPRAIVLTLQKEVVLRIISEKGSILGMSIRAFGIPKLMGNISKIYFKPVPNVDSAILLINEISNQFFEKDPQIKEEKFFKVLKSGFKQKRKKLISNLKDLAEKETLALAFKTCGLEENARAEELSLGKWRCLTTSI